MEIWWDLSWVVLQRILYICHKITTMFCKHRASLGRILTKISICNLEVKMWSEVWRRKNCRQLKKKVTVNWCSRRLMIRVQKLTILEATRRRTLEILTICSARLLKSRKVNTRGVKLAKWMNFSIKPNKFKSKMWLLVEVPSILYSTRPQAKMYEWLDKSKDSEKPLKKRDGFRLLIK